jgi:hypothetical protein
MRTQLNVRVAKQTKKRVQTDRLTCNMTADVIVEVALEDFFTRHNQKERSAFYRSHFYTPYGRGKAA